MLLVGILCLPFNLFPQGLQFFGNERHIADRSSLSIPSDDKAIPTPLWKVDFTYRNHNIASPGNIFHIKNTSGKESLTLSSNHSGDSVTFTLALNSEKTIFSTKIQADDIIEKSIPISFSINTASKNAEFKIGNRIASVPMSELYRASLSPRIFFGMANHMVECASFSIRDLVITSAEGSIKIPLSETRGNDVHDVEGKVVGHVSNPQWLISKSFNWNKIWESYSGSAAGVAFDSRRHLFHSFNADSLKSFSPITKRTTAIPLSGDSLPVKLGMNLISPQSGKIIPYEIYHDAFWGEIDPESGRWKELMKIVPRAVLHHHAAVYRERDNSLFIFGGYGNRAYSGSLIKYDLTTHRWDTIPLSGDRIDPRFFASMMITQSGDSLYIYGGKGNPEGNQDIGIKYYYDLHLIDLNAGSVKKLWEQVPPKEDRIPSRNLIPTSDGRHFYAMTYPEYKPHTSLQLQMISIDDGTSIAVGDTIPMISEEIATNVALYEDHDLGKIFCVTQVFEKMGENMTTVYSISSPPVEAALILNIPGRSGISVWLYVAAVFIPIVAIILFLAVMLSRKRRGKSLSKTDTSDHPSETTDNTTSSETEKISHCHLPGNEPIERDDVMSTFEFPDRNRISIFGNFCVIDSNGRDISYMFSPKLKLIFLYLLLNTIEKDGVSSSSLNSVFWADKEPDKVKNLRNVTLNKLRKALCDIEGVEIIYDKGLFRLEISSTCYCDYIRLHSLTSSLHNPEQNCEADEINHILLQGSFIAGIEEPAFDYFRQRMEEFMVNYLSLMIQRMFRHRRYDASLRLCRVLCNIDPLSETALSFAVKSLVAIGKPDKARDIYGKFSEDYRHMMGEDCTLKFEDITE